MATPKNKDLKIPQIICKHCGETFTDERTTWGYTDMPNMPRCPNCLMEYTPTMEQTEYALRKSNAGKGWEGLAKLAGWMTGEKRGKKK